ncbi:cyclase family protein, partial [Singulisphaera rosea]
MDRRMVVAATFLAGILGTGTPVAEETSTKPTATSKSAEIAFKSIDLTYSFDENTIYWPTDQSFHWEKTKWGATADGHWYASANFAASEHGGTHLDSPIHFGEGQKTTDQIPLT